MEDLEMIITIILLLFISCIIDIASHRNHGCAEYRVPKRPGGRGGTIKYNQPKVPKKRD
jgi:hypothetical protein